MPRAPPGQGRTNTQTQEILRGLLQQQVQDVVTGALLREKAIRKMHGDRVPLPAGSLAGLRNVADPTSALVPPSGNSSALASRASSPVAEETDRNTRVVYLRDKVKDVYGNDGLRVVDGGRYFDCGNCGRKVAGSRFASHIDRCLGGRRGAAS